MLVHKRTLGVLEHEPWDGTCRTCNGVRVPVLRPARLDRLGLNPAEWWKVADGTALALAIHRYYPYFTPAVGEDGTLVGIEPWPDWRVYGEEEPPAAPARPARRRRKKVWLKLG